MSKPELGPLAPQDYSALQAGDSKEKNAQRKTAALIEDALEFLRFTARTNDYFTGYSLAEVITERLSLIGEDGKDDDPGAFVSGTKRTLISRLNFFQETLIGEDGESGAIGAAMEVDDIRELDPEGEAT